MERRAGPSVAHFFAPDDPFVVGAGVSLNEETARHMAVRRMATGELVQLLNGQGSVASAQLVRLSRRGALVQIESIDEVQPLPAVHLLAPIADRDRMLWLAEKCAELGLTSWRPVLWKRSRSVKPRGEGPTFAGRVRARMASALEQSGGAWLPALYPDATPERALAGTPPGKRFVLDRSGRPLLGQLPFATPVSLAVGPEGGFDPTEVQSLETSGFVRVRLEGGGQLRFETAAVAAVAIARAALCPSDSGGRDAE